MSEPLLIHIGYHKTATTWLQEHLFRNPDLGLAVRNGGDRIIREFVAPGPFAFEPASAQAVLSKHTLPGPTSRHLPVITQERLSGSPHSGGYDSQIIADRLKAVFPEARILIVIREQEAIILSAYKQYVRRGGGQPLGRYLAPPRTGGDHLPGFRFEFFEYPLLFGYYQELFGKARVLGLPYEMFVKQPETFVKTILRFCGLETPDSLVTGLPFLDRPQRSLSYFSTTLKRRLSFAADEPSRFHRRSLFELTAEQRHTLMSWLESLDRRLPVVIRLRSEAAAQAIIRRAVKDRYDRSNALMGRLIDVPLAPFGYRVQDTQG
jgi:hypothetical protein